MRMFLVFLTALTTLSVVVYGMEQNWSAAGLFGVAILGMILSFTVAESDSK